ncbi:MAG: acetate--CoA ligase family protein [Minisyncoccia bacterium]
MEILSFPETKKLLLKYNLNTVKTIFLPSSEKEIKIPKKIKFPLVIKAVGKNIIHKTEKKLIALDIKNEKELRKWILKTKKKNKNLDGFLIQEKAKGIEMFFGIKRDNSFGIILILGLGGIFVEVLQDVQYLIYPFSKKEVKNALLSLKAAKILKGYRNQEPVNLDKISDFCINLSRMAKEKDYIREIDFNPVFILKDNLQIVDPKIYV